MWITKLGCSSSVIAKQLGKEIVEASSNSGQVYNIHFHPNAALPPFGMDLSVLTPAIS